VRPALLALLLLGQPPGALESLASRVAEEAKAAGAEAPLAVAISAEGQTPLAQAFGTLLLSRLASLGLAPRPLRSGPDAEASARASGARSLLRLRLSLDGHLTAAGDVLSTWENFFAGPRAPHPGPAAVVFQQVALDAAVRALGSRPGAVALVLAPEPLVRFPGRTWALAAGDLDGDGRAEVAVLTEDAVQVHAVDGRLLARRALVSPPAALPPREAFGTLCICEGLLYAFSAARAGGEVLQLVEGSLLLRATLPRPVVGCGEPLREAAFLPGVARLVPAGSGWPEVPSGQRAWGLAARGLGDAARFLLLLEDGTARAGRGPGGAALLTLPDVGAGAALTDFASDGPVQVAASSAASAPAEDRLRLLSLADGAELARVEVPGQILQVAAAAQGTGRGEVLVLGVWRPDGGAELRLVRGAE
jgi:hypothetical protein